MFNIGEQFGSAFGGLSMTLVSKFGWRTTEHIMGYSGVGIGLLLLLVVKDPRNNRSSK
jgi:predicted MFS family arabinose efflux permease